LGACYCMYAWTGDQRYLTDPTFLNFYRRTVHDYVDRWDLGREQIMTRQRILNFRGRYSPANRFQKNRGIPSYDEGNSNFVVAIDQLAAQYAGYLAYARFQQLRRDEAEAETFLAQARELKLFLNRVWWDNKAQKYYSRLNLDHQLEGHGRSLSVLYYGAAENGSKSDAVLNEVIRSIKDKASVGIEEQSHFPEVLYRYGKTEAAYSQILDLTREGKNRREYPEVSYAVIGAIATGLMGIGLEAAEPEKVLTDSLYVDKVVATTPRLSTATAWAELHYVPLRANELKVRHDGLTKTMLENARGPSLRWRACFPGSFSTLTVDGTAVQANSYTGASQKVSCATLDVGPGDRRTVHVP
jgi:hypothetical protein